jgi:hypothetical protein
MESEAELIAHYHSASGKGQNETPRIVTILQQLSDKQTARFFAVLESHRHSFFSLPWISLRELLDEPARDADADQKHGEQYHKCDQPPQMTMRASGRAMPMNVPWNLKIVRVLDHRPPPLQGAEKSRQHTKILPRETGKVKRRIVEGSFSETFHLLRFTFHE